MIQTATPATEARDFSHRSKQDARLAPGSPGRTLAEGEGRNNLIGGPSGPGVEFRFVFERPLGYASMGGRISPLLAAAEPRGGAEKVGRGLASAGGGR